MSDPQRESVPVTQSVHAQAEYDYSAGIMRVALCADPYCRVCKDQDGEARDDYGCNGHRSCMAHLHVHGCYADRGTCDAPQEHDRHAIERLHADLNGTLDRGDLGDER